MTEANLFEVIDFWNRNYPQIVTEHAGQYVILLPQNPNPRHFEVRNGTLEKLRQIAQERGYKYPFIQLVPTGEEVALD